MKRLAVLGLIPVLAVLVLGSASAFAQQGLTAPVTGTGSGGSFVGSFTINRFAATNTGIVAVGTLSGTVTTTAGQATSVVRNISLPVAIGTATCEILHLELGPLTLDLLGLQIDLSRIVLDITAQSGAGNLLGNLLCAVAGLLDDPGGLVKLLNQILSLLG